MKILINSSEEMDEDMCSERREKFFSAACVIAIIVMVFAFAPSAAFAAQTKRTYCVVDEVVPILSVVGGAYEIDPGSDVLGDDVVGIVVYGNDVECAPVSGKFAGSWLELLDPSGNGALGFIPSAGLEPMPEMKKTYDAKMYMAAADAPELLLMPGRTGEKYSVSKYGFRMIKGEVAAAYGETEINGAGWTMLGFSTSADGDGDGGVGRRYAWARTRDLIALDAYEPDNSRIDPALLPSSMRHYFYSDTWNEGYDSIKAVPKAAGKWIAGRGFWIDPEPRAWQGHYGTVDDMADLYRETGNYSVDFITTDIFFHSFHLIFDRMLENLEVTYFAPALSRGMARALDELNRMRPSLGDSTEIRASFETARDMFSVPLILMGGENPEAKAESRVSAEIKNIMSAGGVGNSSITGAITDYTQYKPRGHYTKSPELEAYFRAMTWLGEAGLPLFDTSGAILGNVRTAALMILALGSPDCRWEEFSAPIDFIMGKSDDGSFGEYLKIVKRDITDAEDLADPQKIKELADGIRNEIAAPKIRGGMTGIISRAEEEATRMPEFRISGKKFTFDAYVFNQLTSPRVGSDGNPRNIPAGTDVMAVLGSAAAGKYARSGAAGYEQNLARLTEEWPEYIETADTVYAMWLKSLTENFGNSGSRQFFYNSGAWQYKKLLTASASWAELKHDTVLYGKQSGAEMGGYVGWYAGDFAPPYPRGYVEPDPRTFSALNDMAGRLLEFFGKFKFEDGYEQQEYTEKLSIFRELCATAEEIAWKEVSGEAMSPSDYEEIKNLARAWNANLLLPGGWEIYNGDDPDELKMAIISDVATDFAGGNVLYAATGSPREILVYVNDKYGGSRIARGYTFSYYEFTRPLADGRMNDGEWKKLVYSPESSPRKWHPAWYSEIYPDWK